MIKRHTQSLTRKILKAWAPPPKLKVSEWAEKYRMLSREDSAVSGKWDSAKAPYQIEIMNSVNDPLVKETVIMGSAQIGKTFIELTIIGYFIHQDPCPMMVILPNKEPLAKDWSRDRIAPMIRDTPVLAERVSDENSTLHKTFPGGILIITGANSPNDLKSRPMRIIIGDEIDGYEVTSEGDPIALAEKRAMTFQNRKFIYVSTPTIEGISKIEKKYNKGTKEKWCIQCPDCGEYVYINFYGMKFDHRWVNDEVVEVDNIKFVCPECGCFNDEHTWKRQHGKYIAENPDVKGIRSFHVNAFYSPWYPWEEIIKEKVLAKKDPEKLMVVANTLFGIPWKEKIELENEDKLLARREEYSAELPDGVLILTCGVDTQDNRLEYEIVGWGKGKESWGIEYGTIYGKPDDELTWQLLDDKLSKTFKFNDEKALKIACTCIDSGGHYTSEVYKFAKKNEHRRIVAIKGQGGSGIQLIHKLTRNKEGGLLVILGVDEGKTKIISALNVKEPSPRYCHYPKNEERGYDRSYFTALLSERQVVRKNRGVTSYAWEKISDHARNEAFDTRNYAQAALELINPDFDAYERRLKDSSIDNIQNKQPLKAKKRGVIKKSESY